MKTIVCIFFAAMMLATEYSNAQPNAAQVPSVKPGSVTFFLSPNPGFIDCFKDNSGKTPTAKVAVKRGKVNDTLVLTLRHFKPGLQFDLFTVQRSNLDWSGNPDPGFTNFGLAWYQSDILIKASGKSKVTIKTILLDQIFGFDPDNSLSPTNTFHVGFWFNNPADAEACGFNVNNPTPFNGDHTAGPLAMISLPQVGTNLGPLCTDPNTATVPASCNP